MEGQELRVSQPIPVATIVPAAGQGSRMGGGKLLLPVGDATVVERTVQSLLEVPIADLVVVIGTYGLAVKHQIQKLPVRLVVNPVSSSEMLDSIKCGLKVIDSKGIDAFLVLPADMPLVLPKTVRQLVSALLDSDKSIAVPMFKGRRGHPVVFRSELYEQVLNFRSPQGIRPLVHGGTFQILQVEVDDEGVIADLDSWDDYRKILKLWWERRKTPLIASGDEAG
ncbi:MAG: nucleotidyltransferase family protein [Candidatus Fervidibacter sp.]|uniref:nucleotidyltransferase family protein n=1 Tax=Candidatus Fervidibacter sp. TaxID=3100871 RepID=UPI004049D455